MMALSPERPIGTWQQGKLDQIADLVIRVHAINRLICLLDRFQNGASFQLLDEVIEQVVRECNQQYWLEIDQAIPDGLVTINRSEIIQMMVNADLNSLREILVASIQRVLLRVPLYQRGPYQDRTDSAISYLGCLLVDDLSQLADLLEIISAIPTSQRLIVQAPDQTVTNIISMIATMISIIIEGAVGGNLAFYHSELVVPARLNPPGGYIAFVDRIYAGLRVSDVPLSA